VSAGAVLFFAANVSCCLECYRWSQHAIVALNEIRPVAHRRKSASVKNLELRSMHTVWAKRRGACGLDRSLAIAEALGDVLSQVGCWYV